MLKTRGIHIAGNWKMNYGPKQTEHFFHAFEKDLKKILPNTRQFPSLKISLFPPFVSLQTALTQRSLLGIPLEIGAQNAHWETKGAFTGEISGEMLKEFDIGSVLIGHSERRQFFGETLMSARKKAESLLRQGFKIIFCIGETLAEREAGKTEQRLQEQLEGLLQGSEDLWAFFHGQITLAYEPIWAIGTGMIATTQQISETHQTIRSLIAEKIPNSLASQHTPILYGGSVTPSSIESLLAIADLDGVLVGGASLNPKDFLFLLSAATKTLAS